MLCPAAQASRKTPASKQCQQNSSGVVQITRHKVLASAIMLVSGNTLTYRVHCAGDPICGLPTHNDFTVYLCFFNNDNDRLVTAGKLNLHIWDYSADTNKLRMHAVETGKLERHYLSICMDAHDQNIFAGTHSGDVLQVCVSCAR